MGDLNNRNVFLRILEARGSRSDCFSFWWELSSGLVDSHLLLCPHIAFSSMWSQGERKSNFSGISSHKDSHPVDDHLILMISLNIYQLIQTLFSNLVTLGARTLTYEFWRNTTQSIARSRLCERFGIMGGKPWLSSRWDASPGVFNTMRNWTD